MSASVLFPISLTSKLKFQDASEQLLDEEQKRGTYYSKDAISPEGAI